MQAGQLRNKVTAHRPTDAVDAYGDVGSGFDPVGSFWMGIRPGGGGLQDRGPGQASAVSPEGFARVNVDVQPRDVLVVTAGPEAGTKWLVVAVLHPDNRSSRMTLEAYTGVAP